jgi:beta-phosphoglucomutase-like phosphatase (HAD superfamily)
MIDAVFFDLDGTLLDNQELHHEAYVLATGFDISYDEYITQINNPFFFISEENKQKKHKIYMDLLDVTDLCIFEYPFYVFHYCLDNNIPTAIVTNSPRVEVNRILEDIPILGDASVILTREDYEEAKPSPDGYNKAKQIISNKYGELTNIIGIEDTDKGIMALKEAGIYATKMYEDLALCCFPLFIPTEYIIEDGPSLPSFLY